VTPLFSCLEFYAALPTSADRFRHRSVPHHAHAAAARTSESSTARYSARWYRSALRGSTRVAAIPTLTRC
jgi:hypothetical protein